MSLWKQLVLILGLVAAATGLPARFLPAFHPVLQRIGLLAPPGMVAQPAEASGRAAHCGT